jgi:hypothetical protein
MVNIINYHRSMRLGAIKTPGPLTPRYISKKMTQSDKFQKLLEDVKRVAHLLNVRDLSRSEYLAHGNFNAYQLYDIAGSWTDLCAEVGLSTKAKSSISDEEYFDRLAKAVKELGRYPTAMERKRFGLNMSKRRYPTLKFFIKEAIRQEYVPDLYQSTEQKAKNENDETIKSLIVSSIDNLSSERIIPPIPSNTIRKKWERIDIPGFPYAPQEEQGVLAIFSILCSKRILPWQILDISTNGIDAICFDEESQKEIHVELKFLLSRGSWNHPIDDLDYLVCWESRWPDFPKPVIELRKLISEI